MSQDDSVQLRKDGGIIITIGPDKWRLRRPTLGEERKLHELWQTEVAEPSRSESADSRIIEDATIEWLQETIRMLGDREPFEVTDDSPPWIINGGIGARFVAHWRSCPFQGFGAV